MVIRPQQLVAIRPRQLICQGLLAISLVGSSGLLLPVEAIPKQQERLNPSASQELQRATELFQQSASLYQQDRYSEAAPLLQEALKIFREILGDTHINVTTSVKSLARIYTVQGRYGEAEPLYQEALAIDRETLGATHPDLAISLNNLALLYQAQGRYSEAEPSLPRSISDQA